MRQIEGRYEIIHDTHITRCVDSGKGTNHEGTVHEHARHHTAFAQQERQIGHDRPHRKQDDERSDEPTAWEVEDDGAHRQPGQDTTLRIS